MSRSEIVSIKKNGNGGTHVRVGTKFDEEIKKIQKARLKAGVDDEPLSKEKITNLITRHKNWPDVFESIVNAEQEEIDQYGHG